MRCSCSITLEVSNSINLIYASVLALLFRALGLIVTYLQHVGLSTKRKHATVLAGLSFLLPYTFACEKTSCKAKRCLLSGCVRGEGALADGAKTC